MNSLPKSLQSIWAVRHPEWAAETSGLLENDGPEPGPLGVYGTRQAGNPGSDDSKTLHTSQR